MTKRYLVTLPEATIESVQRHKERGIDNKRFGSAPRSMAEAYRRLIIIALENWEGEAAL